MSLERYSRQTVLPQIGEAGQRKLLERRAVLIGCGATGTVIANHLARAGVGYLKIVDRDFVELNNLQRQLLFDEEDVRQGLPKAVAAERRLRAVNGEIRIEGNQRVDQEAIRVHIKSRPGEPYDAEKVDQDLRAVYGMGFFEETGAAQYLRDARITTVSRSAPACTSTWSA